MSSKQVVGVMRYIRNLAAARSDELLPDRQLLERFATQRDQLAYVSLLKRHGPMVLSVCRSILHNPHDAEDAFQAVWFISRQRADLASSRGPLSGGKGERLDHCPRWRKG